MKLKFAKGFKPVMGKHGGIVISIHKEEEGEYIIRRYILSCID